jgi:hypothetical protein
MVFVKNLIQSLIQDSQRARENILAFTCGDIFMFIHFGIPPKFMSTLLLAFLGGALGMLGKDVYVWSKGLVKKWTKKKK